MAKSHLILYLYLAKNIVSFFFQSSFVYTIVCLCHLRHHVVCLKGLIIRLTVCAFSPNFLYKTDYLSNCHQLFQHFIFQHFYHPTMYMHSDILSLLDLRNIVRNIMFTAFDTKENNTFMIFTL